MVPMTYTFTSLQGMRFCTEMSYGSTFTAWEIGNIKRIGGFLPAYLTHRRKVVSELLEFEKATGVRQLGRKDPSVLAAFVVLIISSKSHAT
jgi:hypothetical protein